MSGTFAAARRVEVDRLWDDAPLPSGDFDRPVFTSADWPPHSAEALRLHAAQVNSRQHRQKKIHIEPVPSSNGEE